MIWRCLWRRYDYLGRIFYMGVCWGLFCGGFRLPSCTYNYFATYRSFSFYCISDGKYYMNKGEKSWDAVFI